MSFWMFLNLKMEQIPVEFKDAEICYYNRNATYGQKAFKAISCLIDIGADLNGNGWNDSYRKERKLKLMREYIESNCLL